MKDTLMTLKFVIIYHKGILYIKNLWIKDSVHQALLVIVVYMQFHVSKHMWVLHNQDVKLPAEYISGLKQEWKSDHENYKTICQLACILMMCFSYLSNKYFTNFRVFFGRIYTVYGLAKVLYKFRRSWER